MQITALKVPVDLMLLSGRCFRSNCLCIFRRTRELDEAVLNRVESRITEIVWNAAAEDDLRLIKY